jgi:hypothetical protein
MPLDEQAHQPKFSCLMNGISQWNGQRNDMQAAYEMDLGLQKGLHLNHDAPKIQDKWILSSFTISTNPKERQTVYDLACKDSHSALSKLTTCFYDPKVKGLEFYKLIAQHKFVLSPRGRGLDCYRTYEALYLGTFPIVKTSPLDHLFKDLPVLIVDDWSDINLNLLERTYKDFTSPERQNQFKFEKLYAAYWEKEFYSHSTHSVI